MMVHPYLQTFDVECMPKSIVLGRETETGVRELRFEISAWLHRWPDMQPVILATAPGASASYPAVMRMDGTLAVWTIGDSDTAQAGTGSVEIEGRCEGKRVVSASAETIVLPRAAGTMGDVPDPARPWVEEVLDAAARAEAAAERAESAGGGAVSPEDVAAAVDAYLTENPVSGEPGKDGYTPIKGVDYYTAEEQAEMVAAVVAALPVYDGEVADA